MRGNFFVWLAISIFMLASCEQQSEVTYKKCSSPADTYTVEVPSYVAADMGIGDFMSFESENSYLQILIHTIEEETIGEYLRKRDFMAATFRYNHFVSTDTTSFYKITRGNNMWSAYELYKLKKVGDKNFVVMLHSSTLGQAKMIAMLNHISSSIKLKDCKDEVKEGVQEEPQEGSLGELYKTNLYSIKHPKGWQVVERFNEMTDAYIGAPTDDFGFTIVRFEADLSLAELNAEGNANLRQGGIKILEDKLIEVDGVKCYRAVHEISLPNQRVKHISYTFKKGNMLYNIKFGDVKTKDKEKLVDDIMNSFRFNAGI